MQKDLKKKIIHHRKIISNLKKENNSLKRLNNDLVQTYKQKTDFLSNISHELKTPISIIDAAVQLIEKNPSNDKDILRYSKQIKVIRINCFRLSNLVNNILDMAKLDSASLKVEPTKCNIVSLINEIVQSTLPYAEQKSITLGFKAQSEKIIAQIYVGKMESIILNLLSNAIKFTPEGGKISVTVKSSNNSIIISVKDTGRGIPKNKHQVIFKRFYQINKPLDSINTGSGIGLSLVKSLVELHNGSIKVISKENEGSEFLIQLPYCLHQNDNNKLPDKKC